MKRTLATCLAAMLVLSLASCSTAKNEKGGATLVYGSSDYTAINPALYEHGEINSLLFLGLTRHDKANNVVPGLAEDWSWDDATLTYSFKLRSGLTFHDGHALTAEDVKFTFDSIMDPANGSENAPNYEEISSITVTSPTTVEFKLTEPNAAMPDYLTMGIIPKHLLSGKDLATDPWNQAPIGAGPYKFVSWDIGQSIKLAKFDGFCLGAPKIDNIIFKIVDDYSARSLQLKSGELDLAQVTPKDAEEFKSDNKFKIYDMATADYRGILYNFGNAFWKDNPKLPSALSYAIDRDAIVKSVLLGQGQPAYSPIQKTMFNNPNINHFDYNPSKAKSEIEALGWAIGQDGFYYKDGKQLAFSISARPSDQVRVDMANIASQNLKDIGVNATVEINEKTDWAGQYCFLIGWGSPFDADDHTYKVFGTDKGANYSGYSNQKIDDLLSKARQSFDPAVRKPYYDAFQEEFALDPAYTLIAYIDAIYVSNISLKGITPDTILGHHGVGIFYNVNEWSID